MYSEHDYAECSLPNGKKAVFYYSPFCSIDNIASSRPATPAQSEPRAGATSSSALSAAFARAARMSSRRKTNEYRTG